MARCSGLATKETRITRLLSAQATRSGPAMLKAVDVWFAYDDKHVLRGLNLEVSSGQIFGLLGPNGGGKTTLLNLVAGALRPDSGDILVQGISVAEHASRVKQILGFVPDEPLAYPTLSVNENLNMAGLLWGMDGDRIKERARLLLQEVGLWAVRDRWANSLSQGMLQKLSLCWALIHDPEVLVLDEPFTGLDLEAGVWARKLIRDFAEAGRSVLFTSHIPELISAVATHAAVLYDGRIAAVAPIDTIEQCGGLTSFYHRSTDQSMRGTP